MRSSFWSSGDVSDESLSSDGESDESLLENCKSLFDTIKKECEDSDILPKLWSDVEKGIPENISQQKLDSLAIKMAEELLYYQPWLQRFSESTVGGVNRDWLEKQLEETSKRYHKLAREHLVNYLVTLPKNTNSSNQKLVVKLLEGFIDIVSEGQRKLTARDIKHLSLVLIKLKHCVSTQEFINFVNLDLSQDDVKNLSLENMKIEKVLRSYSVIDYQNKRADHRTDSLVDLLLGELEPDPGSSLQMNI